MDTGVKISLGAHALIVIAAMFNGPLFSSDEDTELTISTVALISGDAFADLVTGMSMAAKPPAAEATVDPAPAMGEPTLPDPVAPPAPEPVEEPVIPPAPEPIPEPAPAPEPTPEPAPAPVVEPDPVEPPKPDPAPIVAPDPDPTPVVAPKPVRPSAAPKTSIRPKRRAERKPDPVAEPQEQKPVEEAPKTAPTERPAKRPENLATTPTTAAGQSVADLIAASEAETSRGSPDGGAVGTPTGDPLSRSEREGLMFAIEQCWNVPAGVKDAQDLAVTVGFELHRDGLIKGGISMVNAQNPGSPLTDVAYRAARRAILRCLPYDNLPQEKYDSWKKVEVTFNPKDMVLR